MIKKERERQITPLRKDSTVLLMMAGQLTAERQSETKTFFELENCTDQKIISSQQPSTVNTE